MKVPWVVSGLDWAGAIEKRVMQMFELPERVVAAAGFGLVAAGGKWVVSIFELQAERLVAGLGSIAAVEKWVVSIFELQAESEVVAGLELVDVLETWVLRIFELLAERP